MNTPSPIPLTIVTGASRGLGHAVAKALLADGHRVLTLARRAPQGLTDAPHGAHEHWNVDLVDPAPVAARLAGWLGRHAGTAAAGPVTLINNAAALSEPAPLHDSAADELARAVRVGLEAPLVLTAAFLAATHGWTAPRKVLLVSSGLGRFAMAGSASYCAVKAGLDHLARAVALEEAAQPNGARIVSLAPGVIDTDMQVQLRNADPARFPDRQRFVGLHQAGQLDSPAAAAAKLLRYLMRSDFGEKPVADVREG